MENKTKKIASTTEVKRGKAADKYGIPEVIEIFSVNDMW